MKIEIEWVEIPSGEFLSGLSDSQRDALRSKLRVEFGVDQLDAEKRRILESLAEKYRRTAREEAYFASEDLTPEEKQAKPKSGDPLFNYLVATAELERIPPLKPLFTPGFYIARFPITVAQGDVFFESEIAQWRKLSDLREGSLQKYSSDMPEDMTWEVADALSHSVGGRLPTAFEWEKAARGVDGRLYPWGDEWDAKRGNFGKIAHLPEQFRREFVWRTLVNAYPDGVSPYGVWDMLGNLREWTMTRFVPKKQKKEYVIAKGESAKEVGDPQWFWSLIARQSPGHRYVGCRPVLDEWQRQRWLGVSLPASEG